MNDLHMVLVALAIWFAGVYTGCYLGDNRKRVLVKHLREYIAALEELVEAYKTAEAMREELIEKLLIQNNDLKKCIVKLQGKIAGEKYE